jgi:hypothetical protein
MKLEEYARESLEKDKLKGKTYVDEGKEVEAREKRIMRNALNDLIDRDIIKSTSIKNYYWVNPYVYMKGSTEKIPLPHNEYNASTLITIDKNTYRYRGCDILHEGNYLVADYMVYFNSLEACVSYIDSLYV